MPRKNTSRSPSEAPAVTDDEERFRLLVETIPHFIWSADANGIRNFCNRRFLEYLGKKMEDIKGWAWLSALHPNDVERCRQAWENAFKTGRECKVEVRIRRGSDGQYRWHISHGMPLRNSDGNILRWFGTCTDIHEQKEAEFALAESEARFRSLTEKSADTTVVLDATGSILFTSFGGASHLGYKDGELNGKNALKFVHPNDADTVLGAIEMLQSSETATTSRTIRIRAGSGEWRWFECVGTNRFNDPAIKGLVINARDITEQHRAEKALIETHGVLQTIINSVPDVIFLKDQYSRYLMVNESAASWINKTAEQILGKDDNDLLPPDSARRARQTDLEVLTTGLPQTYEHSLVLNGKALSACVCKTPYRNAAGAIVGVVGIVHDITERKRCEAELMCLNTQLEQRVAERTGQLTAAVEQLRKEAAERKALERDVLTISEREQMRLGSDLHDGLQQELGGIAYCCAALGDKLRAKQLSAAQEADEIGEMLRHAIEETRGLARGLRPVENVPDGLSKALHQLTSAIGSRPNLKCQFKCADRVLIADNHIATHLYRIAQEAVYNSLKHSGATDIVVELASSKNEIELTISDNGKGIPKNQVIFKGLGFGTMKYRAEAIGGGLEIRKAKPQGTVVSCRIALTPRSPVPTAR